MKAPERPLRIELSAPLSGVLVPLDSVPDPVFAQKLVGDGVSIDPTVRGCSRRFPAKSCNCTARPCADDHRRQRAGGPVAHRHRHRAVARRGLLPLVKRRRYRRGAATADPLRPGGGRRKASSLLTQMVIANGELVARYVPAKGLVIAGTDTALYVDWPAASRTRRRPARPARSAPAKSLPNPPGLHARPAAVVAVEAKKFTSDIRLLRGSDSVNAKSVVAIMGLATTLGDKLRVRPAGPTQPKRRGACASARRRFWRKARRRTRGCDNFSASGFNRRADRNPRRSQPTPTPGEFTGVSLRRDLPSATWCSSASK